MWCGVISSWILIFDFSWSYWCVRNLTANSRQYKCLHFDRSKNKLNFFCIVPLKEKEIDPCVNYKTVLLKMQVFVVFTGSEFWGNKTKDIYLFMTELPGDSYCFISPSLGVTWIIAVVCLTTSFPESLNSTSSVEQEQGWLSIPKVINNS